MKRLIKDILRGILIGIANVIPGISGATIAISMGIYDKIIHAVNYIFKEFKKSILYLIPIFIGVVIAILSFSKIIEFCFDNYLVNTSAIFMGLILGALPLLIKKVSGVKINTKLIIGFLAGAIFISVFAFLNSDGTSSASLTNPIMLIIVGAIAAISMVIPGLSGSLVLTAMGYYQNIISTINSFTAKALDFNILGMGNEIFVLTFFGIGVIIGIVGFAKIIEFLFEKFSNITYYTIIGIIVASPIALLINIDFSVLGFFDYVIALVFLAIGFICAVSLGDK